MGKKTREPSPSAASDASGADNVKSTTPESNKKRKRNSTKEEEDELEIDVSLPEPPSKKALRKAKKSKTKPDATNEDGKTEDGDGETKSAADKAAHPGRTVHGIWVGNLPFTADKDVVRIFFTRQGQIPEKEITRIHMPVPPHAQPGRVKPNNKGFAYIDFSTKDSLDKAIALSESLMTGRKVLIKNANSFEGRPEKATATANALNGVTEDGAPAPGAVDVKTGKPAKPAYAASQRIFVGNLSFDTTKDDLEQHFEQAGPMEDIHMATFQDTGKCKGFAWIRFQELEAAQAAVQGFIWKDEPASDDEEDNDDDDDDKSDANDSEAESDDDDKKTKKSKKAKKQKKRKWFLNRLQGRTLRCEFAEDAQSRYKKRYGKERPRDGEEGADAAPITEVGAGERAGGRPKGGDRERRPKKHVDARNIAPGAALANAPRASGAIVEAKGKKTKFE